MPPTSDEEEDDDLKGPESPEHVFVPSDDGSSESEEKNEGDVSDMDVSENDDRQGDEIGLKSLLEDSHNEGEDTKTDKNNDLINDAAAIAESIQPKGNTLSSTTVNIISFRKFL